MLNQINATTNKFLDCSQLFQYEMTLGKNHADCVCELSRIHRKFEIRLDVAKPGPLL